PDAAPHSCLRTARPAGAGRIGPAGRAFRGTADRVAVARPGRAAARAGVRDRSAPGLARGRPRPAPGRARDRLGFQPCQPLGRAAVADAPGFASTLPATAGTFHRPAATARLVETA